MKAILILSIFALIFSATTYTYYKACASSYVSIADALKSIGVDSSYSNREKIAAVNGITGYSGTADQNHQLLTLLKNGKLIKSKTDSGSNSDKDNSSNINPKATVTKMMNRISTDKSLSLTATKKNTFIQMGTVLLNDGYEPAFVAGVLGNIMAEGSIGFFEKSNYVSHPENKPDYLKYMDNVYSYSKKYSGKYITDVSLSELSKLMETLKSKNWKQGKFGLGCVQWTGGRTYNLVKLYITYANGKDKITLDQATKAEAKMIGNELKSNSYKKIYTNWKANNKSLKTASAAYNAGSEICLHYEIPHDPTTKAKIRGNNAQKIFNVMMG